MPEREEPNPLSTVWRWVSGFASVLALSNMFSEVANWIAAVDHILDGYRAIIDVMWWPITVWFPWEIPWWVKYYVVLGIITLETLYSLWS